jgi:membrane carboxypeptidase/penicillin-binding protein
VKDRPEWFTPPPGIVTATVCGESGMLAGGDCDNAVTEYFARGTVPTETFVPIRPAEPDAARVATDEAIREAPRAQTAPEAPASVTAAAAEPSAPESADNGDAGPPKKKHGFWGRLFGKH